MSVDEDWGDLRTPPLPLPLPSPSSVPEELQEAVAVYEAERAEVQPIIDAWKAKFVGTRFEEATPTHYATDRFMVRRIDAQLLRAALAERYPEVPYSTVLHWAMATVWWNGARAHMHHIEVFAARLRHAVPGLVTQLDKPTDEKKGVWTLDIYFRDLHFYAVSQAGHYYLGFDQDLPSEEYGYNPIAPRHVFDNIPDALAFILNAISVGTLPEAR